MPDKLIPGEKKTPVYKKQKFGEGKTPFQMKVSPMQRNFNIAVATKTGVSGLTTKDSPVQWAWLLALGKSIAAGAKVAAAKVGVAATKLGAGIAKTVGAKGLATKLTTTAGKIGTWGTKALAKKATAKAAMAATKTGKFLASKTGKAVTSHLASSIMSPPQRSDEASKIRTNATAGFASMKFGTGGSRSAFTMKKSPIYDYKKGYYGV